MRPTFRRYRSASPAPTHLLAMLVVLACSLCLVGAACSSTKSSSAQPTPRGTITGEQGWPRVENLRGERYCEVLLARLVDGRLNAEVWNTYTLNDCPEAAWNALDPAAIKTERGVLAALLNGPRYWLMDAIEKQPSGERKTTTFGTLEMFLGATVDLGPIPPNLAPYTERHVARGTVFEYEAGSEIYELLSPDGKAYVMQSYSRQKDAALTEEQLPGLASRITPPAGWSYRARTLDSKLRVTFAGVEATVLQDDLSNTYSLLEAR